MEGELVFVIVIMVILFAGGVIASALFIRQWRLEHKEKQK